MNSSLISVYVGLGSNLQDPLYQVTRACAGLGDIPHSSLVAVSPWYRSSAVGPGQQPDFINGVAQLTTTLDAERLLDHLQAIENAQGRQREVQWGARTLDLDLLLYGDTSINSDRLVVPHNHLRQRNFVVYPLFELAPQLKLPSGEQLAQVKQSLDDRGLQRLGSVYQQEAI